VNTAHVLFCEPALHQYYQAYQQEARHLCNILKGVSITLQTIRFLFCDGEDFRYLIPKWLLFHYVIHVKIQFSPY